MRVISVVVVVVEFDIFTFFYAVNKYKDFATETVSFIW